jgi:RNA polymerase sigma-70 factor (ECF subfamily)
MGTARRVTFITGWMHTFTTHREGGRRDAAKRGRRPLLTEEAFHAAIDAHGPAVYRFALAHVGTTDAEDVMAETFATAWANRAKFVDDSNNGAEAWLIAIARNMIHSHRRAERRWLRSRAEEIRARASSMGGSLEHGAVERVSAADLVKQARVLERLARLPERERDPFLLHVLHGWEYQEIAEALGVPLGTVQSRISRGRAKLAKALRAREEGR